VQWITVRQGVECNIWQDDLQWSAIEDKAVRKKVQWRTRWPVREGMEERRARKRVYGGKGSQKWNAMEDRVVKKGGA
jgi:hypothetical protein